jgi:hypothetical protein
MHQLNFLFSVVLVILLFSMSGCSMTEGILKEKGTEWITTSEGFAVNQRYFLNVEKNGALYKVPCREKEYNDFIIGGPVQFDSWRASIYKL